jgi:serine/threonine protein kinase
MMSRIVGNYEILAKIGEGGMGEVFRARDLMLEREVAIKSLRRELATREDIVERFRTEAVALAKLNHRNVAAVHSFFRHEEQSFMVLEFVCGETLDTLIARRGALPWREAVGFVVQALDGLDHAHRAGVVHRDIKPSNIMISPDGTLKLMDFGIARVLEKARLTRTGHLVGTLEYMSPEQIQGRDTDARSDLYSLGIVFYEMVTGAVPFTKGSDYELIKAQVEEVPRRPRLLVGEIPAELDDTLMRALAKRPEDRFQSAASFRMALSATLSATNARGLAEKTPRIAAATRLAANGDTLWRGSHATVGSGTDGSAPVHISAGIGKGTVPASRFWTRYPGVIALVVLTAVAATVAVLGNGGTPAPAPPTTPPLATAPLMTAPTSSAAHQDSARSAERASASPVSEPPVAVVPPSISPRPEAAGPATPAPQRSPALPVATGAASRAKPERPATVAPAAARSTPVAPPAAERAPEEKPITATDGISNAAETRPQAKLPASAPEPLAAVPHSRPVAPEARPAPVPEPEKAPQGGSPLWSIRK